MDQGQDRARISGYLSEDSKRKFTLVAGVLGAVFFLLQILGPMVVAFAIMPVMMFGTTFTTYALEGAALHGGEIYLVAVSRGLGDARPAPARTRLVRIGAAGIEDVASLDGWEPRLLADGERLWLVSSTRMGVLDGREVQRLSVPEALGDISRPFLFEGTPAVIETRPDGERLVSWREGRWQRVRALSEMGSACCVQLVPARGGFLVLREKGQSLFARNLDRPEQDWTVVASKVHHWYAFQRDGLPAVASSGPEGFRIAAFDGKRWAEIASAGEASSFPEDVAAFQPPPAGPLTVVSAGFPGTLKVRTWDQGKFSGERRLGRFSPFPPGMAAMMWLPQAGSALVSLLLAVVLSSLMRAHRVSVYVHEGVEVPQASLTRRALSQVVDAVVLAGPAVFVFARLLGDFEAMFSEPWTTPFRMFGLMAGSLAWALLVLVLFGLTEGRWGVTPGKWLLGIRVVGTDLSPCGFGRGLIRNVLKLVDGFFNFIVGILMVAFTPEWQRLGDLAARTIVIRRPRGGLRGLADSRAPAGGGA